MTSWHGRESELGLGFPDSPKNYCGLAQSHTGTHLQVIAQGKQRDRNRKGRRVKERYLASKSSLLIEIQPGC